MNTTEERIRERDDRTEMTNLNNGKKRDGKEVNRTSEAGGTIDLTFV